MAASPEKNLAEILAQRMQTGVPVPVPLALAILRQVCDALEWAHNQGIVHGDVSPPYILVAGTGVARLVGSTSQRPNAAYLSPEYLTSGMLDTRADLFALGVVAHEMLSNRPLFASPDEQETIQRVCMLAIPLPSAFNPAVPPDLDNIVLMALSRDPTYRWQRAAVMRDGLLSVMQRLGFELGGDQDDPWADLLGMRAAVASPDAPFVQFAARESPPPQPRRPSMRAATDPDVLEFMSTISPHEATGDPQPPPPAPDAFPAIPSTGFELDIPEGTQIGAVPLVSFGDSAMAVIGEKQKPAAPKPPTLPPPMATFLPSASEQPDDEQEPTSRKGLLIAIAILVIVVAGAFFAIYFGTDWISDD